MTFVKMYMDIYEKYGAKSPEMARYKEAFIMYKNKPHIVERVYRAIMNKKADRWPRRSVVSLDVERPKPFVDKGKKICYIIINPKEKRGNKNENDNY